ncbi:hypothetical protein [Ruminococcus flavefaciens]|uniref:Uncharacterized protein n=1 Tax=Ruminococcus flavefaciens TaxID=1265 RepID=A0A1M7HWP7_RUMFL|nr:hypothetical protein [Ruminococcus flavefaciens]SHM33001.1 hypothetical protein SAMN04487860_103150 [Ruminococcus flavefaciens]
MKWVIRHITDDMYAVSPRFFVYHAEFARRFTTRKLAVAYIVSSGFDKKKFKAEVLEVNSPSTDKA